MEHTARMSEHSINLCPATRLRHSHISRTSDHRGDGVEERVLRDAESSPYSGDLIIAGKYAMNDVHVVFNTDIRAHDGTEPSLSCLASELMGTNTNFVLTVLQIQYT